MTTMTNIHTLRGVSTSKIAEPQATTANLSLAEKRALLGLTSDIQAAASAVDAPKKRLAAVSAAATSKNQRVSESYKAAVKGLVSLGMTIDAIAASGDIAALDTRDDEKLKWTPARRIMLKSNSLSIVGAIRRLTRIRRILWGCPGCDWRVSGFRELPTSRLAAPSRSPAGVSAVAPCEAARVMCQRASPYFRFGTAGFTSIEAARC